MPAAGNAFLRTYQLLVSPSVLSYLIQDQFFHFTPPPHGIRNTLPGRLELSVYVLSLKEWNLDTMVYIAFNEQFDFSQVHLYLSGIFVSGLIGYLCFRRLEKRGESAMLDRFHGHCYEYPRLTIVFLVACLGLAGFPITPTFIGEDIIMGHMHQNQFGLTVLIALGLILDGLVVFRIYARLFLGPHEKGYHEVAYRSS